MNQDAFPLPIFPQHCEEMDPKPVKMTVVCWCRTSDPQTPLSCMQVLACLSNKNASKSTGIKISHSFTNLVKGFFFYEPDILGKYFCTWGAFMIFPKGCLFNASYLNLTRTPRVLGSELTIFAETEMCLSLSPYHKALLPSFESNVWPSLSIMPFPIFSAKCSCQHIDFISNAARLVLWEENKSNMNLRSNLFFTTHWIVNLA